MVNVENTGRGTLNLRFGVSLKPGKNQVEADAWAKCREEYVTKHYLSEGRVKVVSGSKVQPTSDPKASVPLMPKVEPAPPPSVDDEDPVSLSDMKVKEAKAWVASCLDYDALESAIVDEKRSSVVNAIEDRLGALGDED